MVAGVVEVKRIERSSLGCKPSALPLSYTPLAGLEGFEPSSGVLEAPLPPWLRPMAARTGAAPVSLPRQGSCDAGRITSRSLLARSRTESSRLGNASLGIRQDEENVAKTFRSWRRREHSLIEVRIVSRGVTYGCCLRRRPIHSRPGSLAPSRHSPRGVNRTRDVEHPKLVHYHCATLGSEGRKLHPHYSLPKRRCCC